MATITGTLNQVREQARGCTRCPLYKTGTQTVFGEGPSAARILMIGEQPGDQDDLVGKPFVGPAGKMLDKALAEASIERSDVYVTNAVKHFKWKPAGKRRLHQKPTSREIAACRVWLDAELDLIHPDVVVALGATAAQSLMGRGFRVTLQHGEVFTVPWAKGFVATLHPSSILRAPSPGREEMYAFFVNDLRAVAQFRAAIA